MYKVVQINTVYNSGSTGKITASIESISRQNDVDMYIAYGRGKLDNSDKHYRIGNKVDFLYHVMMNFCGRNGQGSKLVTKKFLKWLDGIEPDLIHLHNIHGFYINYEMLFQYIKIKNIPVVWTLHDCWPFTGQCSHFDYANCDKWQNGCHDCPIYRSDYPYSIFVDNSKKNYMRKRTAFTSVRNMTIVTPSEWLGNIVNKSFLGEYKTKIIPNGIDLNVFKNVSLDNEKESKIILAVANVWDKRKGLKYLLELSKWYNHTNGYQIVIIGLNSHQVSAINKKYSNDDVLPMTRTKTQEELVKWYNEALVLVNPTLQDNYPTTNLEAVACGTPVVTFRTGGSPETIDETCGIVVDKGSIEALREAIETIGRKNKSKMSFKCLEKAKGYDKQLCFNKYIGLYKELLD